MNWRNRTKKKLIEYKGGKCQSCGYDKDCPSAYDFHHRDPTKKDFTISKKSWSIERLKNEIDKCDLLCRNCHAEVHWQLINDNRKERLKLRLSASSALPVIKCKCCNKEVKASWQGAKCCSINCARKLSRKVERPVADVLLNEVVEFGWTGVGRKYGVTDNTVRKWAKVYGIFEKIMSG
jgi:hypothetical protein